MAVQEREREKEKCYSADVTCRELDRPLTNAAIFAKRSHCYPRESLYVLQEAHGSISLQRSFSGVCKSAFSGMGCRGGVPLPCISNRDAPKLV